MEATLQLWVVYSWLCGPGGNLKDIPASAFVE